MRTKNIYPLGLQTLASGFLKALLPCIIFLAACTEKNHKEVETQKSEILIKSDTTQKPPTPKSDTVVLISPKEDTVAETKQSKSNPIDPPYPVCHPYLQTILLTDKQLKGPFESEIGVGKNLVASIFYDNDLMTCGDAVDAWYLQDINIEFLNFSTLKAGTFYDLPNENLKISSSASHAWGHDYYRKIGGRIIFHKLNRNLVSASVLLIDLDYNSILFNKANLSFSLKSQKFDEAKVRKFLSQSEETSFIKSLPPLPLPKETVLDTTIAYDKYIYYLKNDTTIHYKLLDEPAKRYGEHIDLGKLIQDKLIFPELNEEIKVVIFFVIEKDGRLTRVKLDHFPGMVTEEQADKILTLVNKYSDGWKPAMRSGYPRRSLNRTKIILRPKVN